MYSIQFSALLVAAVFLLFGCENTYKNNYKREKNIRKFLEEITKEPPSKNFDVIIIPSSFCGACTSETLDIIRDEFFSEKVIVILEANSLLSEKIKSIAPHSTIVTTESKTIEKYGLVFVKTRYIKCRNSNIECSLEIIEENIPQLTACISK